MVNFINTAPIHEMWKMVPHPSDWEMIEAVPAKLNRMLAEGKIDLGFVSSHEYCVRPEQYRILSDLSISSNGSVGSVYLFSDIEPERLDGRRILLSNQSETSVSLLKIILEEFYGIRPEYLSGRISHDLNEEIDGVLAIGDEAIRLAGEDRFKFRMDLGEVWKAQTGLPFVFSVCCVQEDMCVKEPEMIDKVHRELVRCRMEGQHNLDTVCKIAAPKIPVSLEACKNYLEGIEHDFNSKKQEALKTFFRYLIRRGEASENALPLKIEFLSDQSL